MYEYDPRPVAAPRDGPFAPPPVPPLDYSPARASVPRRKGGLLAPVLVAAGTAAAIALLLGAAAVWRYTAATAAAAAAGGSGTRPWGAPAARPAGPVAPPAEPSPADELEDQLATIERDVDRLRAAGDGGAADALAAQLRGLRGRLASGGPPASRPAALPAAGAAAAEPEADPAEVHVVGVYAGGAVADPAAPPVAAPVPANAPATGPAVVGFGPPQAVARRVAAVELTATDRPAVLVLCAHEPVRWELKLADGARLRRVLLAGSYDQQLADPPAAVPVDRYVAADRRPPSPDRPVASFGAFRRDEADPGYRRTVDAVRVLTGRPPDTFLGTARYDGRPIVVGPANPDWAAQRVMAEARPLYEAAAARERAEALKRVAKLRFRALWETSSNGPFEWSAMAAEFTPLGPIKPTRVPLPGRAFAAAADPASGDVYVLAAPGAGGPRGLVRVDGKTEQQAEIKVAGNALQGPAQPPWTNGLTMDTRRGRLVLLNGGATRARLVSYTPASNAWAVLGEHGQTELSAICYSAAGDCFYAVGGAWPAGQGGRGPGIVRIDPTGTILTPTAVAHVPGWTAGLAGRGPMGRAPLQLAAAGNLLAVIVPPPDDALARAAAAGGAAAGGAAAVGPTCHLVDPVTGQTVYSGPLQPQPGP